MKEKRITIGLFVSDLNNEFDSAVCKGVMQGVKEVDANLVIFPGRYLKAQFNDKERTRCEYQHNTLFSYANEHNIDVLLVLLGTIGTVISDSEKKVFLDMYQNVPTLLLAEERKGYSSVSFDNRIGFRDGISTLIGKGCKNIGFVSGPVTNEDAIERLDVYKQVLSVNGIDYDESKVVYGNFSEFSEDIVSDLLDRNPDLDAIVFANDHMAIGGYSVMKKRGIKIGEDILVMGFDDSVVCQELEPNLTTIKADAVELGRTGAIEAANYLATRIERKKYVKTSLIQRESTGVGEVDLLGQLERRDFAKFFSRNLGMAATILMDIIIVDKRKDKDLMYFTGLCADFIREFFMQLRSDEENIKKGEYLYHLVDKVMTSKIGESINIKSVLYLLNSLRSVVAKYDPDKLLLAEELIYDYHSRITSIIFARKKRDDKNMENLVWVSNCIAKDMLVYDENSDMSYASVIDKALRLGCKSAYLYSFVAPYVNFGSDIWHDWPIPKTVKLKAYSKDGSDSMIVDANKQEIESLSLFKNDFMPEDRRYTLILNNAFVNEEQLGIFAVEIEHDQIYMLAPLVAQISTGLKIINMLKVQTNIEKQLESSLLNIKANDVTVETLSKVDALTGLCNRRGFFEKASEIMKDKRNSKKHGIILFTDMDNISRINEKCGREQGDEALKSVADILKEAMRVSDIVARIGNDEFAVLAITDEVVDASTITDRIRKLADKYNEEHNSGYKISLSIGHAAFECKGAKAIEEYLEEADAMLCEERTAKKQGRV